MESLLKSVETIQALDPAAHLSKFLHHNVRPSSRPLQTPRPTSILPSPILSRNTTSSTLISIGGTRAIAGTTLQIGQPHPSSPTHGEITVSLHVGPLCHPRYDSAGRILVPEKNKKMRDVLAIESFVERTIRQSNMVDLSELCVEERKSAWKVMIQIVVLNHDGNLEDVAILGAVVALNCLELPSVEMEGGRVVLQGGNGDDNSVQGKFLNLRCVPVPLSIGLFGDKMLVDPDGEEDDLLEGMLTVVVDERGVLISVNKLGGRLLGNEEMKACFELAQKRANELVPIIKASRTI